VAAATALGACGDDVQDPGTTENEQSPSTQLPAPGGSGGLPGGEQESGEGQPGEDAPGGENE